MHLHFISALPLIAPTEEMKMRQLRKRKRANWGNKNAPTEEMKIRQLRKCEKK